MSRLKSVIGAVALGLALMVLSSSASAETIIWGGPTSDPTTNTGYQRPPFRPPYAFPSLLPHYAGPPIYTALPIDRVGTAGDGTAVGYAVKFESGIDKGERAVRWDTSGAAAVELGNLGTDSSGVTMSSAFAVNAAGTAVGFAEKYESGIVKGECAVRWNASGTAATELGNPGTDSSGYTGSSAFAVNAAGTAVGIAAKLESGINKGFRAVRWDALGTAATELGHLGTTSSGVTDNYAVAVNATGTAVGFAAKLESGIGKGLRAVRWDASGTVATELGNLGTDLDGITENVAFSINNAGIAVGYAYEHNGISGAPLAPMAVAWGLDGLPINLNTLLGPDDISIGWRYLYEATSISDTNWITGYGIFDPDGNGGQVTYKRMFLLGASSLIPEPASLTLLALGGLAMLRRRGKDR